MKFSTRYRTLSTIVVATLALSAPLALAQTAGDPLRLIGATFDPNTSQTGSVQIDVTRWSTKAEVQHLLDELKEKGEQGLLQALQKNSRVGSIRSPGSLAYDLRYAERADLPDGGSQILLATDRPISFGEIASHARSVNYPFTWIEINMKRDGQGDGKMSIATKVIPGGRYLVLENYDAEQVVLRALKEEKIKIKGK